MAKIERFEDIIAWQKARALVAEVYGVSAGGKLAKDFALHDQIRRAGISIMLNIAEGFARRTNKEFAQFLFIAHGSVAEVQAALYIALDEEYISREVFDNLYLKANEVSMVISGFIKALR